MLNLKKDFPVFNNNPWLIYLDSTASTQKSYYVIDWEKEYLENYYSNIHRWMYDLAIKSEKLYDQSKKKVAQFLWADSYKEIIYTYNSTYAINLLVSSIRISNILKKWDKVLLSIAEHHANIVPWLMLKNELWIQLEFINVDKNFDLDFKDFEKKYDEKVKIISITHVSNVTWQIFDLEKIWKIKNENTLFIADISQSIPHIEVNIKKLNLDFTFFTWHKILADSWIWVLWWKKELLEKLNSSFSWWGSIWKVTQCDFTYWKLPYKFEPGTPNLTWSISLLRSLEYIEKIWWYKSIESIEDELIKYTLEKFNLRNKIKLIWSKKIENRLWVFSFIIDWIHSDDIADIMAENNICIRAWKHCAHPLLDKLWIYHSCRMSLYIYNTKEDIDNFFDILDNITI